LKDTLNVITYEGTYFLMNMCAVSFISNIYVSRTAVPKKVVCQPCGFWLREMNSPVVCQCYHMVDWLMKGIIGRFLYGNEPSGSLQCCEFTIWESISFSRMILFHGLRYYCMIDSQTWCVWRSSVPLFVAFIICSLQKGSTVKHPYVGSVALQDQRV
jgi:hypothetical protein